jgi:hypothetical protein
MIRGSLLNSFSSGDLRIIGNRPCYLPAERKSHKIQGYVIHDDDHV